jgi:DNA-binding response OmpR family regulator
MDHRPAGMSDSGVRIFLIVEDDPEIQFFLKISLQEDDREIIAVERGDEAKEVLATPLIDLSS